jgi:uncharacterized protein
MWRSLAAVILRFRYILLFLLVVATGFFGWQASKVKLSYEFSKAIPTDNPKYIAYQEFKTKFGEEAGLLVIGIRTDRFFDAPFFAHYRDMQHSLKKLPGIQTILSVPSAFNLIREEATEKLKTVSVFPEGALDQSRLDSCRDVFLSLPFYRGLLYNPDTKAWMMAITVDPVIFNSPRRSAVVKEIMDITTLFSKQEKTEVHLSGLPLIRTVISDKIQKEMRFFLIGSVLLSGLILLLFFRSVSATLLSLLVVITGVIWSIGMLHLLGYKITILTALIPPLMVVIGVPNCIYFLNKYHTSYRSAGEKPTAIIDMVGRMGIVTLFCNIAAAIGFAVFYLTKSEILKEFGAVAGISIMMLFFISLILIPAALSFLAPPAQRHTRYLDNRRLQRWLNRLERWALNHRRQIFAATAVLLVFAVMGMMRLKTVGFIVEDLPKNDKVYTDLKFFEEHFKGVMPLEIAIDTRKKYGITRSLPNLMKIDSLSQYLASRPYAGRPLNITEGLKFAKQAFFEGDSTYYIMPGENDLIALRPYLSASQDSGKSGFSSLLNKFIDKDRQETRISVNMKDVGTEALPLILDSVEQQTSALFDSASYKVRITGTSVTFLEGSKFIINGLRESILWAFLLIALCMLYLFRSFSIMLCSLIPNLIPLVITAGIMGWAGVPLKPSTVLIFSVALGIAIDITIRFLINYKQQLRENSYDPKTTAIQTIHATGLSIIYTSVVLIAGFVIFCFSGFGGTEALGWLTSITLITATVANLVLLPALLLFFFKKPVSRSKQ